MKSGLSQSKHLRVLSKQSQSRRHLCILPMNCDNMWNAAKEGHSLATLFVFESWLYRHALFGMHPSFRFPEGRHLFSISHIICSTYFGIVSSSSQFGEWWELLWNLSSHIPDNSVSSLSMGTSQARDVNSFSTQKHPYSSSCLISLISVIHALRADLDSCGGL